MPTPPLGQLLERKLALAVLRSPRAVGLFAKHRIERDGNVLDRQVQAVFQMARLTGHRGAEEIGPVRYRRELDAIGTTLGHVPPPMEEVRDLRFSGADGSSLCARLYVPYGVKRPSPGLIYFHGGGFVAGSIDSHDIVTRSLADEARCRVLSCEYRMAPEHPYPAAVLDGEAAFAFAVNEATSLGLDATRLAVGGDSAGGNLSAVLASSVEKGKPGPMAQLLIYPAVDLTMSFPSIRNLGTGFMLEEAAIHWFRKQYAPEGTDLRAPRLSPYYAELKGAPRAIVVTAGFDPLRDEGRAFAEKLRAADVPTTLLEFGSLFHGFLHVGAIDACREASSDVARALRTVWA